MPTVEVPAHLTVDHLMAAVRQLSPTERREFRRKLTTWEKRNGTETMAEAALLASARARLPAAEDRRLKQLSAKSERGTLTPRELEAYRVLAEKAEQLNVTRVDALVRLQ